MNLNSLFVKSIGTRLQLINYQTVRWRKPRKPFWLGVAKSKKFIVPQPRVIRTPEERKEYIRLDAHYNTELKSILNFIKTDNPHLPENLTVTQEGHEKLGSPSGRSISDSLLQNDSFNEESARRREERMKKAEEEEVKKALELIEFTEENKRKHLQFVDEIVRKEKALSESFITPENIDEAIEKCLKNVECFDFAIDLDGNRFPGRESLQFQKDTMKEAAKSSSA